MYVDSCRYYLSRDQHVLLRALRLLGLCPLGAGPLVGLGAGAPHLHTGQYRVLL